MTVADYTPFVERMIGKYEGGYGWSREDPGGPTKYGITCYDLAEYLGQKMDSMTVWAPRVKAMTLQTADEIYKKKYATACQFDALNAGCDCVVFDFGVNSGSSRAIKFSQVVAGTVSDGIMGPMTIGHINGMDPVTFVNKLCDVRLAFLRKLGTWGTFGRGWSARVRDLRQYSLGLLTPPTPAAEVASYEPQPKELRIHHAFAKGYEDGVT